MQSQWVSGCFIGVSPQGFAQGPSSEAFVSRRTVNPPISNHTDAAARRNRYARDTGFQCRSNVGRGVPRTAIAPTTSNQNGSTPKPGIASRASPGNSSHCHPSTMNSSSVVAKSTTQTIGSKGVAKAPMASEMPAMAKASASRFLENLIFALAGCLLGSIRGGGHLAFEPGLTVGPSPWGIGGPTDCLSNQTAPVINS
jgi:hypothetical protein